MRIQGPFQLGIVGRPSTKIPGLHRTFTPKFKASTWDIQARVVRAYLAPLGAQVARPKPADRNRSGMLIAQKLAQQLVSHIGTGELAPDDTPVVEMAPEVSTLSLVEFLK